MKNTKRDYGIAFAGLVLFAAGLYLLKTSVDPQGLFLRLPYIFIGLGSGAFGCGLGNIILQKAIKRNPDMQKHLETEKNDERNIAIASLAKAKAYDLMTYTFAALLIIFALMGVDTKAVLLLVLAYLSVQGYSVYCLYKYNSEM